MFSIYFLFFWKNELKKKRFNNTQMLRPNEETEEWFNLFVIHQNRQANLFLFVCFVLLVLCMQEYLCDVTHIFMLCEWGSFSFCTRPLKSFALLLSFLFLISPFPPLYYYITLHKKRVCLRSFYNYSSHRRITEWSMGPPDTSPKASCPTSWTLLSGAMSTSMGRPCSLCFLAHLSVFFKNLNPICFLNRRCLSHTWRYLGTDWWRKYHSVRGYHASDISSLTQT